MEKANSLGNKVAIMQPYFFPYIGYFQLIKAVDNFVFFDNVQYIKRGWVNRNRILEINKEDTMITVPVNLKSRSELISNVYIDNSSKWQNSIIKAIEFNYKRSEFYDEIFPFLREHLLKPAYKISELNIYTIINILELLSIKTKTIMSSTLQIDHTLKAECKILEICSVLGANTYINPIGGIELYNRDTFRSSNLNIHFIKTKEYSYKQNTKTFIPHLSILDVLFCCGTEETKKMLDNYELI